MKNLFLLGIGTAAYSYEKAITMVEELVAKGELTINQGKQLNQELKQNAKDSGLANLNLATKDDIAEIKQRLANLEQK